MQLDSLKLRPSARELLSALAVRVGTERRAMLAAYGLLMAAALAPLFLVEIVPVAGFTNHMARVHVLANHGQDPMLQQAYRIDWAIKPNLAIDLLLPALSRVMGVFEAGRLFVAVSMLMLVGGTVALHRVLHGKLGLWPAASFLFLYNQALTMGFLNFQFGLGLALVGAAGWTALRQRPAVLRVGLFTLVTTALFFSHLMSVGIYAVLIGGYEFMRAFDGGFRWRTALRDWAAGAAPFVLPAVLLVAALPPAPEHPSHDYGGVLIKLFSMLSPMVAYRDETNAYLILLVVAVVLFGLATRRFATAPNTGLALGLLAAVGLAAPFTMYGRFGGVWGVDLRVFVALAFVAVAVLDFRARSTRVAGIVCAAALAAFAARVWSVGDTWITYDRQFAEYRRAARVIEPGSKVMQAENWFAPVAGDPEGFPYTYWYLATLSVIDRAAFVPTFYSDPRKQPVVATPRYEAIDTPGSTPVAVDRLRALADPAVFDWFRDDKGAVGERLYGFMWQDVFDYVVLVHSGDGGNPVPELLSPVARGSFFDIYRVSTGCLDDYPDSCRAARAFRNRAE